jgi:hypothetical protein
MSLTDLSTLTTFDLAFNLATGIYSETEKLEALRIIKDRERKAVEKGKSHSEEATPTSPASFPTHSRKGKIKLPKTGSKTEVIYTLLNGGSAQVSDVYNELKKKGVKVFKPEIYRVAKLYYPEVYDSKND